MFKIGDRVRCIKAHSTNRKLIVGREYIIYDMKTCNCGYLVFYVGLTSSNGTSTRCRGCNMYFDSTRDDAYFGSMLFEKAEEKTEYKVVKLEIEVEEPCLN